MKARIKVRKEEKKKLTCIERDTEAAGCSAVVKNGVSKTKRDLQENGVVTRKPAVVVSEQVTVATVHRHSGAETVPNGTTVIADGAKSPIKNTLAVPTEVANQNGGHVRENGHLVQDSNGGAVVKSNASRAGDKKEVTAEWSREKDAGTPTDTKERPVAGGTEGKDELSHKEGVVAVDLGGRATTRDDDGAMGAPAAAAVTAGVDIPYIDRPDSIDISRADHTETAKSPGEDNPAFEATSPWDAV